MVIPEKLNDLISLDPELNGYVSEHINLFLPWIESSGTPFFTNYTDHGIHHLSRVLNLCEWIIEDETWKILSPEDGACIVFAVLCHDLALHLTPDSFRALIEDDSEVIFQDFDNTPWHVLWSEYLNDIRYWDDKKWLNVTGKKRNKGNYPSKNFEIDISDLRESDLPLIGEFIRIHHTRLAHEFTFSGIPSQQSEKLEFRETDKYFELLDISGVVARSHGMSIRGTYNYLEKKYFGKTKIHNILPLYLMSVLRLADFLDIQAERAPKNLLKVKSIKSPFSKKEWFTHHAIKEVRYDVNLDPEKIEIIAKPKDAIVYQKIISWVNGIQKELDHSWAVIGEIYGRLKGYSLIKLRIRRISSPLQDADFSIVQDLSFIPKPAKLDVDPTKVIEVLIEPLYGKSPEVAVRELLQNAIDAVKELDLKSGHTSYSKFPDLEKYNCDILATLFKGKDENGHETQYLEIQDRGKGMSEHVIRNYFLKIGAKYNESKEYLEQFDENDRARLNRIGRFGIGILAAFLAGKRLDVYTKNFNSKRGIKFSFSSQSTDIELQIIKNAHQGTIIKIDLDEEAFVKLAGKQLSANPGAERLSIDWFVQSYPRLSVRLIRDNKEEFLKPKYQIPQNLSDSTWREFTLKNDSGIGVQWSREMNNSHLEVHLNGIFVQSQHYQDFRREYGRDLRPPVVNILDGKNVIQIKSTRDKIIGDIQIKEALIDELMIDYISWLIFQASAPTVLLDPFGAKTWDINWYEGGSGDASSKRSDFLICKTGLIPFTAWNIKNSERDRISCLISGGHNPSFKAYLSPLSEAPLFFEIFDIYGGFSESRESVLGRYFFHPTGSEYYQTKSWTLFCHESLMDKMLFPKNINRTAAINGWIYLSNSNKILKNNLLEKQVIENSNTQNSGTQGIGKSSEFFGLFNIEVGKSESEKRHSFYNNYSTNRFEEIWKEFQLPPIIPFELETLKEIVKDNDRIKYYLSKYYISYQERLKQDFKWWE